MSTIAQISYFFLIAGSIIVLVSNAAEHGPPHHEGSHLGDSTASKKHQNTIIAVGVQTPDHVLSAPKLSCLSADDNIFDIMDQAQEKCNGTDIRCTFYHFVNHNYDKIGSVDINKERFDDLLMKFDNWLLTDEDIEKNGGKIKENHVLEETNENSSVSSGLKGVDVSQSLHVDVLDDSTKETSDDKENSHHVKPPHETHHKIHHSKDHNSEAAQLFKKYWKDSNHIVIDPEFNTEHKYFEVFIPRDKVTGKPRTIYVEVNEHKNEFVILDEDVDKKLKDVKPIRIELDELSDIADTAFNEITKSSNFKEHVHHHLNDDEKAMISDISSGIHEHKIHLDADVSEHMRDTINVDVHYPHINAIDAKQLLVADDEIGKNKKVLTVTKNQLVPNNYTNQSQFEIETHLDNITDHNIINDHVLDNSNETANNQVIFHEEEFPLSTAEFNENNIDLNSEIIHNTNTEKSSPIDSDVSNENDNNTTKYNDLSTDNENVTYNDDHLIELEENNNTYHGIDSDKTHEISAPNTFNLNEPSTQIEKENMPKQFIINIESDLTPSVTSDYSGSQFHAMPSEHRRQGDIFSLPLEPTSNISPEPRTIYGSVPKSTKVLKSDSRLPGSVDLPTGASQMTPRNSFDGHPTIHSYNSPKDTVPTPSSSPTISQFSSPIPPVECAVKLNTESKSLPNNFGISWLPSKIEELNLPSALNPLSSDRGFSPNSITSLSVPSMGYSGSSQSPSDHTTLFKDSSITYNAPSVNIDIQEPSLSTRPCESESATPDYIVLSKLGLPTPTDSDRMSFSTPLSSAPCGFIPPNINQQIPSDLQQNVPCPLDSGFSMISPFDKNLKDTMIPCPPCTNRYPYSANHYFSNPCARPSQFIPSYMEPFRPAKPFQPVSKIPTVDISSICLDNSHPCPSENFLKETKPMPILPFTSNNQYSPLNPLIIGSNFPPSPNVWNNVPYLPYTDRNVRNYAPFVSNFLTPSYDQNYKPLYLKEVPISMFEQPCLANNLAITPSSYTPCLSVQTSPSQNDINPSLALERDLENLSLKYGISLSILNSLQKDMSDSSTCTSPHSNLKLDNYPKLNKIANVDGTSRNGDFLTLDSTLQGPHLRLGNPLVLDENQFKEHTITVENITPADTQYLQVKNQPTNVLHDSSFIGPHLLLPSSNILSSDEHRNANKVQVSESEFSNSMHLDSSLIGPHLKMGRPQVEQGSTVCQNEIFTSHTEVPIAVSSQIRPKLNQNELSKSLLDTSLIGAHLPSMSPVKPLLSNEIQNMNEIVSLNSELTDLTPKDIPPVSFGNELNESGNYQNEKFYLDYPPTKSLPTQLLGKGLVVKDSSSFKHLDSTLIGPGLKTGNLPIQTDNVQQNIPVVSQYNVHNTKTKHEENIIVPSAFVPDQKYKPIKTDLNLKTITHGTELNTKQPVTDISQTTLKETDFKIVEPIPNKDNNDILLQDSDMSLNTKIPLENSLIGKGLLINAEKPIIPFQLDYSTHLDNSLVGPSMLNEMDSQYIATHEQRNPFAAITINHVIKPADKGIDSKYNLDSSLIGPSLHGMESQGSSIAYDSVTLLDSSLVPPSLNVLGTSFVANAKIPLDSSLTNPSLYNPVESSTSASTSHLDSSLLGPSLKPAIESSDKIYDSTLMGPHLTTAPNSNGECRTQSDLGNVKILDSSLKGTHLNIGNQYDQPDISRCQNQESLAADVVPGIAETTNFLNYDLIEDTSKPSIHASNMRETLSKFKNSISKSQLSGAECKPCDKILSSIANQFSVNSNTSPPCSDVQPLNFNTLQTPLSLQDNTVSEYSPNTMAYPQKEFSPLGSFGKAPCLKTNNYPISQLSSKFLPYAQGVAPILPYSPFVQNIGVPQTPISPYPQFIQINPQLDCNRVAPQYQKTQNSYQDSSGFRPMELSPEEFKLLLDLTSQSKLNPKSSMPNIYSPEIAMIPSSDWTRPSNVLPLDKYISSLPKTVLTPSTLESTICNSVSSPKGVDVMSPLDINSYKLLQDMSILPSSQSSLTPNTISNPVISPSSYMSSQTGLYIPQNIPCNIPTPNNPPSNLQPYSYIASESEFSEIDGQNPETMPLSYESLKPYLQSYPHTPELIESMPHSREFQQKQLPCLDSPSFSLDTVLQTPTASYGSDRLPWPSSPPISSTSTKPMLPRYTSPSSVYVNPLSTASTSFPLNILPSIPSSVITLSQPLNPCPTNVLPYASSPLSLQSASSYTANSVLPDFSSTLRPLKTISLSDYPYPQTSVNNRPISSTIPYTPSPKHASPCLLVPAHPVPINFFYEPLSAPCSSVTKPISFANVASRPYYGSTTPMAITPIVSMPAGILSPSYISPGTSTYNYLPIPAPNALTNPSSAVSSTSISPVSPILPAFNRPLHSKPAFNLNLAKTPKKPENIQQLNAPISYANNQFLNTNPMVSALNRPIQNQQVPKLSPLVSSQLKEYKPSEDSIGSNFQIIEGSPTGVVEENMCIYSNDKGDKFYEEPNIKYPLESVTYTLPPEEVKETGTNENLITSEDLTSCAPLTNLAPEPSPPAPYPLPTPLYEKPCLSPQQLLPSSLLGTVPQSINNNIPIVPPSGAFKRPVSETTSMLPRPVLNSLTPFTSATNLKLLSSPCTDTRPYNIFKTDNPPLFSSSYNSASGKDMLPSPIEPGGIKKTISSLTPDFSQLPPSMSFASPISSPKSNILTRPYNPENYFELPLSKGQGTLVKSSTVPGYQYPAPIISSNPPSQMPILSPYVSSLTTAESLKKSLVSPQYICSTLPLRPKLLDSLPFYETPNNYQPYVSIPTGLTNSADNIFKSPLKPLSNSVLPSVKLKPLSTNHNALPSLSFSPQNYLPVTSPRIPSPSTFISAPSLPYTTISPEILKPALSKSLIPSSLHVSSNVDLQKPLKISSPFNNILRYNYPAPAVTKPLLIAPCVTSSKLSGPSLLPQNILKPITQYSKEKDTSPLSSSAYQTQPFEKIYQPVSNPQYPSKPLPKLSPVLSQLASPTSSPIYSYSQTIPIPLINKPQDLQFSLPTSLVCNVPSYSSLFGGNPLLNPNLNPIPKVSSYPVSDNPISSLNSTPFKSNLLSNLRPLGALESYSSLLKPLSNMLSQNPGLHQYQSMPINSQYISSPSGQLLPCTSPLQESPILKPLLTNLQNYSPPVSIPPTNLNTALPESSPITTSATSDQVWPSTELSISELAKKYGPITPPTIPYDFSKLPLFKQNQSPVSMASNSNYDAQGPSLNVSKADTVKPTEVSAISSSESSQLSLETEPLNEITKCKLTSDNTKETLPKLPMNFNQLKQYYPGLMSKYVTMPQPPFNTPSAFKFKHANTNPSISLPSIIPEDVELIDTTDFNPIQSESLLSDQPATVKNAPITNTPSICREFNNLPSSANTVLSDIYCSSSTFKQLPSEPLQNPSMTSELDMSKFFPHTLTSTTDLPSFPYKQIPLTKTQYYNNQRPQSPVYQSAREYKDSTQDLWPLQMPCAYTEPQLTSPLTRGPNPISEIPFYTEAMFENPENYLQLPNFSKSLEIKPEIENILTLFNKNRYFNKLTPEGVNNYAYEPKSTTVEVPLKLDCGSNVFKPKETYTEYTEDSKSNVKNNYITESNSKSLDKNKPYDFEDKATNQLPQTIKDFNFPDYNNNNVQRPQRLSNLEHFSENNYIGKTPQSYNEPAYNILPKDSTIDVVYPSTTKYPKILSDLSNIPCKNFGSKTKLDDSSLKPSKYYPEIAEKTPKCYPQNFLSTYAQIKPNIATKVTETSEIPPTSSNSYNDMEGFKYSGYKTYQIPSLKSPKALKNFVMPAQMYNPLISYTPLNSTVKFLNHYKNSNAPRRTEITEPVLQTKPDLVTEQESPKLNEYDTREDELAAILSQYQKQRENTAPIQTNLELNTVQESPKLTNYIENESVPVISQHPTPEALSTPFYSKLGLDAFEESPNLNEYDTKKDESIGIDGNKENNELKTSLINFITKAEEIKNNLDNNNKELTIHLGKIAIIKKEPYEFETMTTNNPSIGLKVWQSNAKIVQAELNLKFKDLSVTNFMPVVDNIDKFDMDEIRKIVKNYIDEKYGKHIEIKEPFTVDNQYTVLKEFDHNAVSNKYNLLWPAEYV